MENNPIKATALMTWDPTNPGLYEQGQVVFHNGSFYNVHKDTPSGSPELSSDFSVIEQGGASTFNVDNSSNYQQGQIITEGDKVYLVAKDNPQGAPGSSEDYIPLDNSAPAADFLVSPGTGVSGAAAQYNAQLNNLTFAIAGATGASGKAVINISVSAGASGPVVVFDGSKLAAMVNNLMVTQTYDPGQGEQDTGTTYHGKAVFRRAFEFTTNRAANEQDDRMLIDESGYVDAIVNTGGYWMTGNQAEKFPVNAAYVSPQSIYGFAYVSTNNKLVFRSNSSLNRDGSAQTANNFVWVDYTRVDSTTPLAPSSV